MLEAYPYYCAYVTLLASYIDGKGTEASVERGRQLLQEAEGGFGIKICARCAMISRASSKLHHLGLDTISVHETGYMLRRLAARRCIGGDEHSSVPVR